MASFWPADAAQRHRLTRYLMALGATAVVVALFYVAAWARFIAPRDAHAIALYAALMALVFFVVLRSGLNLRMPDPSLSREMIVAALAAILYGVASARSGESALLLMVMLPFVFAMFRFGTRGLLILSALVVGAYAGILHVRGDLLGPRAHESLATLLILAFTLIGFSLIGGTIAGLRHALARGQRQLEDALRHTEHLAMHDELTGIYNRRYLEQRLSGEVQRAQRYGTALSVALLDLDRFKEVNDELGHAAGDVVLIEFARLAGKLLRESDCLGRWGGEEFIILMPETDFEAACIACGRLGAAQRAQRFAGLPRGLSVTVSAGVAAYRAGEAANVLLQRADMALYRAKVAGRDRVEGETRIGEPQANAAS
ncbi:MAG: GGDEF domain-containing protein [Burkholderiales bacterium]|nr:GGDEF domain-containing protein [Burkholderiales bacterium]